MIMNFKQQTEVQRQQSDCGPAIGHTIVKWPLTVLKSHPGNEAIHASTRVGSTPVAVARFPDGDFRPRPKADFQGKAIGFLTCPNKFEPFIPGGRPWLGNGLKTDVAT